MYINNTFQYACTLEALVVFLLCSSIDVITVGDVVVLCVACALASKCQLMVMIDLKGHVPTVTIIAIHPNSKTPV